MSAAERLAGFFTRDLLVLLWAGSLVRVFVSAPWITPFLATCLLIYLLGAFVRARRTSRALAAVLAAVSVVVAWPDLGALWRGFESSLVFAGFMPTLWLASALADSAPEVTRSRDRFAAMPPDRLPVGMALGAHALGAILTVGALAVLAAVVPSATDKDARERAVLAALRGMNIAVLWSPFFVGMAFALHYVPSVGLVEIMPLGFVLAMLGVIIGVFGFCGRVGWTAVREGVQGLLPILPMTVVSAVSLVLLAELGGLTTLDAMLILVPLLAVADLARRPGDARMVLTEAYTGLGRLGDELLLVMIAVALGGAMEGAPRLNALFADLLSLNLPPIALIAAVLTLMIGAACMGIHPIVTATIVFVGFAARPDALSDLVLVQTVLYGWALGTMTSITSLSVTTSSVLYGISRRTLAYGPNLRFAILFAAISTVILAGVDFALRR